MIGKMAWPMYCIPVVQKKSLDRSLPEGTTSVYEANRIAKLSSKLAPTNAPSAETYRVQIGSAGYVRSGVGNFSKI